MEVDPLVDELHDDEDGAVEREREPARGEGERREERRRDERARRVERRPDAEERIELVGLHRGLVQRRGDGQHHDDGAERSERWQRTGGCEAGARTSRTVGRANERRGCGRARQRRRTERASSYSSRDIDVGTKTKTLSAHPHTPQNLVPEAAPVADLMECGAHHAPTPAWYGHCPARVAPWRTVRCVTSRFYWAKYPIFTCCLALCTVHTLAVEALEVSHQTCGLSYVSTSKYAPQY